MSVVGLGMDALLGLLLLAAIAVGLRLNGRLRGLREGQASFVKAVGELDAAAMRAEAGLSALRAATLEAHDHLLDRIDTARALATRLDDAVETAQVTCARIERMAVEAPIRPAIETVRDTARSPTHEPPQTSRIPAPAPRRGRVEAIGAVEDADGALARFVARRGERLKRMAR